MQRRILFLLSSRIENAETAAQPATRQAEAMAALRLRQTAASAQMWLQSLCTLMQTWKMRKGMHLQVKVMRNRLLMQGSKYFQMHQSRQQLHMRLKRQLHLLHLKTLRSR